MGVRHEQPTWLERIRFDRDQWKAICPTCARELQNVGAERGFCPVHGSVFVDFGHPRKDEDE